LARLVRSDRVNHETPAFAGVTVQYPFTRANRSRCHAAEPHSVSSTCARFR
jgi:hypothetical protein